MDREDKKYQEYGFTIKTIFDAVKKGLISFDKKLVEGFFESPPPDEILKLLIEFKGNLVDTRFMQALKPYLAPDVEDYERRARRISAFVAGLTGQDPNIIKVDLDQQDTLREADAAYAEGLGLTERQYTPFPERPVVTEEGLADAAWTKYKETGDTEELIEALSRVELKEFEYDGVPTFAARYTSGQLQFYGLQDDLQLANFREAAGNQNLTPVFNFGIASTFLAGMDAGRIANVQDKLMRAGFLQPGTYVPGVVGAVGVGNEDNTIEALEASFSYFNTKPEYALDVNDLREINELSGGEEGVFLGFMRNYFEEIIEEVSIRDINPIITAPTLIAQANPEFLKFNVNQTVRDTIGANPSLRDYEVIYNWASGEIERLSAAYAESQKVYEQARVDVAAQAHQDRVAGKEEEYYLLPPAMSDDDVSAAFATGLDEFVYNYFKPMLDQGKEDQAYQQGLGVAIASLSK